MIIMDTKEMEKGVTLRSPTVEREKQLW